MDHRWRTESFTIESLKINGHDSIRIYVYSGITPVLFGRSISLVDWKDGLRFSLRREASYGSLPRWERLNTHIETDQLEGTEWQKFESEQSRVVIRLNPSEARRQQGRDGEPCHGMPHTHSLSSERWYFLTSGFQPAFAFVLNNINDKRSCWLDKAYIIRWTLLV